MNEEKFDEERFAGVFEVLTISIDELLKEQMGQEIGFVLFAFPIGLANPPLSFAGNTDQKLTLDLLDQFIHDLRGK